MSRNNSCSLASSFRSTIPERKERLLIAYLDLHNLHISACEGSEENRTTVRSLAGLLCRASVKFLEFPQAFFGVGLLLTYTNGWL